MPMQEISFAGFRPIDGYGPGFFRIGGIIYRGPVLVTAGSVIAWGGFVDTGPVAALTGMVDVVFLGTGTEIAHPPPAFREAFEAAGIGLEPMGTPAACRSYNVILAEGRRIAALLVPVG